MTAGPSPLETSTPGAEEWIDVTVPLRPGMVCWPGNPAVELVADEQPVGDDEGFCRVSRLACGVHTGTHVDAPIHFGISAQGVDSVPLSTLIGTARVIAIANPGAVTRAELEPLALKAGERILLKTRNSTRCWSSSTFVSDYVYVTPEAAGWFVERRVRMVGVDYLSVGGMEDGHLTHHALLEAGISILEGLDLSRVEPGIYDLIALPLRVVGSDGAPARVVLRRARRS
jgi:arylformamidase